MKEFNDLAEIIRIIAKKTIESEKITTVVYGKVVNEEPLKIRLNQKLTLDETSIFLTRNVTDFDTMVRQSGGEKRTMRIYNGLKVGESVIMIRLFGGQNFLVIDRVGGMDNGTE